ncbi:MAG: response regulator [Acidobacteria bacterium]|nr:response regulator [Acidobacteriota bacterium]
MRFVLVFCDQWYFVWLIRFGLTLGVLLLTGTHTQAQPALRFEHIREGQGLTSGAVRCLAQDSVGFLWIGTERGVFRYDGITFKYYPLHSTPLEPNVTINCILADQTGGLWVGSQREGLFVYNRAGDRFVKFDTLTQVSLKDQILSIFQDSSQRIWIGTRRGLVRYDLETRSEKFFQVVQNESWPVRAIAEDSQKRVWVATSEGLFQFDPNLGTFHPHDVWLTSTQRVQEINRLCFHPAGFLFVGTRDGLWSVKTDSGDLKTTVVDQVNQTALIQPCNITSLLVLNQNTLLVGGQDNGLAQVDAETGTTQWITHDDRIPESLSGNSVTALLRDRFGVLWVGNGVTGLDKHSAYKNVFRLYQNNPFDEQTISGNYIRGICEDREGFIWVCTQFNGLNRIDLQTGDITRFTQPEVKGSVGDNRLFAICEDRRGTLWVGMAGPKGLHTFNRRTRRFELSSLIPSNTIVFALYEDFQENLWAGTSGGLYQIYPNRRQSRLYRQEFGFQPSHFMDVQSVMEDRQHRLWIGLDGDLIRYNPTTGEVIHYAQQLKINQTGILVGCIREDSQGRIWIATKGAGIFCHDPIQDRFEQFTTHDGLPHNVTYAVLEDLQGRYWISTDNGIARFDPVQRQFVLFGPEHGLQGKEFNRGAYCRTRSGVMFFGGTNGLNQFTPGSIQPNPSIPPVVVSQVLVNGIPLPVNDSVTLGDTQNTVGFEFAVLDFNAPELNRYSIQLEGVNQDWVEVKGRPQVMYGNLLPGTYWFRVKGANSSGVWNEQGAAIRIVIPPPWWRTSWAYGGYLVLIGGGLSLFGWMVRFRAATQLQLREATALARAATAEREVARARAEAAEIQKKAIETENLQRGETEAAIRSKNEELGRLVEQLKRSERQAIEAKEEAVRASRAKSEFLANMSHEIRTPMNAILGMAQLLSHSTLTSHQREYAQIIQSSTDSLLTILNDILDFSKIEAGAIELEAVPFDLVGCIEDVVKVFAQPVRSKGVELRKRIDPGLPAQVYGDPGRIRQILLNLIGNAVKFTHQGWIEIAVELDPETGSPSNSIRFKVQDTGIGIPADRRDRLFKSFSQVDASTTRKYGGTGLGLAISSRLVALMGGQIQVESTVGKGSTFRFTLPFTLPSTSQVTSLGKGSLSEVAPGSVHPLKILLVEDNQINQKVALRLLEKLGYRADVAINGREACHRVEQCDYDLLLMDIQMPEMDGLEATRWIRSRRWKPQPWIVAMTANAFHQDREACFEAGMNGVVVKPVRIEELEAMLVQVPHHQESYQGDSPVMVLQPEVLERISVIFDSQFAEILNQRLGEIEAHVNVMEQAIEAGEREVLLREAQLVKNKSGILGAERLAEWCSRFEPEQSLHVQRELWQRLSQEVAVLEEELQVWLRTRKNRNVDLVTDER